MSHDRDPGNRVQMGGTPGGTQMYQYDESIQNLSKLAVKLNEASDSITLILNDLEAKLQATQIGLEVWLPERIDEEVSMTLSEAAMGSANPEYAEKDVKLQTWHEIGWAKVDSKWRLAYRLHETRSSWNEFTEDGHATTHESIPRALNTASRLIRIHAVSYLESLIGTLTTEAKRHIQTIECLENPLLGDVKEPF